MRSFRDPMPMEIMVVTGKDKKNEIDAFYETEKRLTRARDNDIFFVAVENHKIIGAVRFCIEETVPLLRGMLVQENKRKSGIGKLLLERFDKYLVENKIQNICCLPYTHLEKFYGSIGFKTITSASGPKFLCERLLSYRENYPQDDFIMMRRA